MDSGHGGGGGGALIAHPTYGASAHTGLIPSSWSRWNDDEDGGGHRRRGSGDWIQDVLMPRTGMSLWDLPKVGRGDLGGGTGAARSFVGRTRWPLIDLLIEPRARGVCELWPNVWCVGL